jgi:hypothetical protein
VILVSNRLMELLHTSVITTLTDVTDSYPYFAPDTAQFPWITMVPISNDKTLTFKNEDEIEDCIMQFSVFDNDSDTTTIETIMAELEHTLHRNCPAWDFPAGNVGGLHIVGIHKFAQPRIISGPPAENFYRHGIIEFRFRVQMATCT